MCMCWPAAYPLLIQQADTLKAADINVKIENLKKELTLKDANTAALHQSLERSLEDKLAIQSQIDQLAKMGDAAGKKQVAPIQ